MGRYLIRRALWALLTLWGLETAVFFLLRLFPGGPFDEELAIRPEIREALERIYGVSGSPWANYLTFLKSCLRGDLGASVHFPQQSVTSVLGQGFLATWKLGAGAFLLSIVLALSFAVLPHLFARANPLRALTRVSLALPNLFLAPLLLWILCFHFGLFPLRVDGTWYSLCLPIFLLAFRPACSLSRILDVKISEAAAKEYALVHRSVGMSEKRLVMRWLLRVSLPSFVQQLPVLGASLLSGSLLIEMLFSSQGLGYQLTQSLLNRDWSLALGLTLFFGAVLIALQVFADALTMTLDPRVRVR